MGQARINVMKANRSGESSITVRRKQASAMFVLLLCAHFQLASAWTVNNFLMTGPKAFLTYASSVQAGAQSGIHECKHQFAWERWNCPESTLQLSTNKGLRSATKETAFVHAISAAGVMYALTKNCSLGDFDNCGCDDSKIGQTGGRGWIWGGCSDNVDFGEKISRQFVDALEDGHDSRAAVNLHNNEAGRWAVKATMRKACKCHGVSGSCSIQTCWMQLADFREVGNFLKAKHEHAKKLDKQPARAGNSADSGAAIAQAFRGIGKAELVYVEDSPDYCVRNRSVGVMGTEGRECVRGGKSAQQPDRRSCRRLCTECGFRVAQRRAEVVGSCNCKFHWCCTVKCDKCTQVVTKHHCARRDAAGRKRGNKTRRKHAQR